MIVDIGTFLAGQRERSLDPQDARRISKHLGHRMPRQTSATRPHRSRKCTHQLNPCGIDLCDRSRIDLDDVGYDFAELPDDIFVRDVEPLWQYEAHNT